MRAGHKVVVVAFSGCPLWSGNPLERDEGVGACARWCDADFREGHGHVFDEEALVAHLGKLWPDASQDRWCLFTGGEPASQVTVALIAALKRAGWQVAVETSGAIENVAIDRDADWVVCSPKLNVEGEPFELKLRAANEVKVVIPGGGRVGWTRKHLLDLEDHFQGARFFVAPEDPLVEDHTVGSTLLTLRSAPDDADLLAQLQSQFSQHVARCEKWVNENPTWALTAPINKLLGIEVPK